MEAVLTFADGRLTGTGRDRIGEFTFSGQYDTAGGKCSWVKHYLGQHLLNYRGFNEGKGIWGTWEYNGGGWQITGGFHIWPEGMADPTQPVLHEEVDLPLELDELEVEKELELVPAIPRGRA
jgi:hypothetical protein